MRITTIAAAFGLLFGISSLTGVDFTRTGPDRPAPTIFEQGGGGGP